MTNQFFKTIEGIDIFLTPEGKFTAKIAGKNIEKRALRDLEKQIEETLSPVIVYELSRYSGGPSDPVKREILKFEKGRARLKSGELDRYGEQYYLINEAEIVKIDEFLRRQEILEQEWRAFVDTLPRVDHRNFEEIRKKGSGSAQ